MLLVVVNVKIRIPDGDPLITPKLRLIAAMSPSRYVMLVTCCASGMGDLRNPYTVHCEQLSDDSEEVYDKPSRSKQHLRIASLSRESG